MVIYITGENLRFLYCRFTDQSILLADFMFRQKQAESIFGVVCVMGDLKGNLI